MVEEIRGLSVCLAFMAVIITLFVWFMPENRLPIKEINRIYASRGLDDVGTKKIYVVSQDMQLVLIPIDGKYRLYDNRERKLW